MERDDNVANEGALDYLWLLIFEHEWSSLKDVEQEYEDDTLVAQRRIGFIEERGDFEKL